jgi:hypothetical protein
LIGHVDGDQLGAPAADESPALRLIREKLVAKPAAKA